MEIIDALIIIYYIINKRFHYLRKFNIFLLDLLLKAKHLNLKKRTIMV